jgi:phosphatidylglycerophosphatase A
MNTKINAAPAEPPRKPRLSLFFATAGGVGYLPKAPGTWGSLVGLVLYWLAAGGWVSFFSGYGIDVGVTPRFAQLLPAETIGSVFRFLVLHFDSFVAVLIALIGVASAGRVARFARKKDPQFVVIDEVSGQLFTFLFALAPLNWKYLLLGFILFRVFDIWKPFPARQAESLPGGWGIMADDWIAAVYAAIGIWIARGLGL